MRRRESWFFADAGWRKKGFRSDLEATLIHHSGLLLAAAAVFAIYFLIVYLCKSLLVSLFPSAKLCLTPIPLVVVGMICGSLDTCTSAHKSSKTQNLNSLGNSAYNASPTLPSDTVSSLDLPQVCMVRPQLRRVVRMTLLVLPASPPGRTKQRHNIPIQPCRNTHSGGTTSSMRGCSVGMQRTAPPCRGSR